MQIEIPDPKPDHDDLKAFLTSELGKIKAEIVAENERARSEDKDDEIDRLRRDLEEKQRELDAANAEREEDKRKLEAFERVMEETEEELEETEESETEEPDENEVVAIMEAPDENAEGDDDTDAEQEKVGFFE